ncbi:MAG: gliding motility-associated-like protein, partial [Polaribacter sp.]
GPTIAGAPADETVECDAIPTVATITATDNCDSNPTINSVNDVILPGSCTGEYVINRAYSATDNCGNVTTVTQVITVEDTTGPTIAGVPADETVECDAIPTAVTITATDNCDTNPTINPVNDVILTGSCIGEYVINRAYSATDDCGNVTTVTQVITVEDTTGPTIAGVPADETVECDAIPTVATITATDNCDANPTTNSVNDVIITGICTGEYVINREYSATDDCGNVTTATQVITVIDAQEPTLAGVPVDESVDCGAVPAPGAAIVTATDNCDTNPIIVTMTEIRTDGACGDDYILVRTWSATDDCGNVTTASQSISVSDVTGPTLVGVPTNEDVDCSSVPVPATVTATDDCDTNPIIVSVTDVIIPGTCSGDYEIQREYSATDNCGNVTTVIQMIMVTDTEGPGISGVPANETVPCTAVPAPVTPTATDNCDTDPIIVSSIDVIIPGACNGTYTINREYTAIDNCGNATTVTQVIEVIDDQGPIITGVLADVTVSCDAIPVAATATATDDCDIDPIIVVLNDVIIAGACDGAYTINREYKATDDCGNATTVTQIINVEDNRSPVLIDVPADLAISCEGLGTISSGAEVTATDDCDSNVVPVMTEITNPGSCPDSYTIVRTWTATDDCGNATTATQIISVGDTTPPVLDGIPADENIDCDDVPAIPTIDTDITATDNCSSIVAITFNETNVPGPCLSNYTLLREWTATDECGNASTATQTIIVGDNTAPVITAAPADVDADCNNVPAAELITSFTATDNCDPNVIITFREEEVPGPCNDTYTLVRIWTTTDACGNTAEVSQDINVSDTTPPILSGVPTNVTVPCDAIPGPPSIGSQIFATDDCDSNVEIVFDENIIPGDCPGSYIIDREWTAYDDCFNEVSVNQIITVFDDVAPMIFNVPVDITINIENGEVIPPVPNNITATDNCDPDVVITFEETQVGADCNYDLLREWTATDHCGNTAVEAQTINVIEPLEFEETSNDPICVGYAIELSSNITSTGIFSWTGPNGFTSNEANPVILDATLDMAGTYTLYYENDLGCYGTADVRVAVNPELNLDFTATNKTCVGGGSIVLGVSGGVGSYLFDWEHLLGTTNPQNIYNLNEGVYGVTITDAGGCTYVLENVEIENECDSTCYAVSGSMLINDMDRCIQNGQAVITATADGNAEIPTGYEIAYLLTTGVNSTIIDYSTAPTFTVMELGEYTVHALVYDPATYDITVIILGTTTLYDANAVLIQGGGFVCGAIDLGGASITVHEAVASVATTTPDNCDLGTGTALLEPANYIYQWPDFLVGNEVSGLDAGTYQVTATDEYGCTVVLPVVIGDTCICIPPVVSSVETEPSCGEQTGTITILPEGNPATYTYAWDPPTGGSFNTIGNERTNITAGIYCVTVSFPALPNCETVECVALGNDDGPEPDTIIMTPATCAGADGSVSFEPTTLTYIWNDIQAPANPRTGMTAGDYELLVLNPLDPTCPDFISVTVEEYNQMEATATVTSQPSCATDDGVVEIISINGVAPFTYTWNGGTATSSPITGLGEGDYFITVEGANGCLDTVVVTLATETGTATITISPTELDCYADANGKLNYTVSYDPGFQGPDSIAITDSLGDIKIDGELTIGYYCVTVFDMNGCLADQACTLITEPEEILGIAITTASDCSINGTIDLTVTGGVSPYVYAWAPVISGSSQLQDLTNLEPGNYIVTITDARGCTEVLFDIEIDDTCTDTVSTGCDGPNFSVTVINANCGIPDGSATVMIDNPAGYDYTWSDPSQGNTPTATGLIAGLYSVTVTDKNDPTCFDGQSFVVENINTDIEVLLVKMTPEDCDAENGSITVTPGFAAYEWNTTPPQFTDTATDLPNGTYTVLVTDDAGCKASLTAVVTEANPLSTNIVVNNQPDCAATNGSTTVVVSDGDNGDVDNYTYVWSPNGTNTTETADDLAPNTYYVTVTDEDTGCTTSANITLAADVPQATITLNEINNVSCVGDSDGSVTYNIDTAPGFVGLEEVIILNAALDTVVNGMLDAGSYTLEVADANGCLAGGASFEIEDQLPLSSSVAINNVTCDSLGRISVVITGGVAPYTYEWSHLAPGGIQPSTVSGLAADIFFVMVTDANACSLLVNNLIVTDECEIDPCAEPVISLTAQNSNCLLFDGSVTVNVEGSVNNYIISWSTPGGNTQTISNVPAGTYTVTVCRVDDTDCCSTETISLSDNSDMFADVITTTAADCDYNNGFTSVTTGFVEYDWSESNSTSPTASDLPGGLSYVTITDGNGCKLVLDIVVPIDNPLVTSVLILNQPDCDVANGEVQINVAGGSGDYSYEWDPNYTTLANPSNLLGDTYSVTVTDNVSFCKDTIEFTLLENVPGVTITINGQTEVECFGDANGTVNYSISYDPGFVGPGKLTIKRTAAEGGFIVENGSLDAGNYILCVEDFNGCDAGSIEFEVTEPNVLAATAAVVDVECDDILGSIDLTISGGIAPYDYDWAHITNGLETKSVVALSKGEYDVTITDANDCMIVLTAITVDSTCSDGCTLPVITLTGINPDCIQSNGSVSMNFITGDPALYNFFWDPLQPNAQTVTDLPTGEYTVTVSLISDPTCQVTESIIIDNGVVSLDTIYTTPSDCDMNNGEAAVTQGYASYEWNNTTETTSTVYNLPAGENTVTVTDEFGCQGVLTIFIGLNNNLTASEIVNNEPDCSMANGSVTIDVQNGSGSYTYNWIVSPVPVADVVTATNLPTGNYEVLVIDNVSNCNTTVEFTLTEEVATDAGATIVINAPTTLSCYGATDGDVDYTLTLDANFATADSTIIKNNQNGNIETDGQLPAGDFTIEVYDANGCFVEAVDFTVTALGILSVSVSTVDAGCEPTVLGSITVMVSGGAMPYVYSWSVTDANPNDNILEDLNEGSYDLTITDNNGCTISLTALSVDNICDTTACIPPVFSVSVNDANCGALDGSATVNISNVEDYITLWSNGDTTQTTTGLDASAGSVTVCWRADETCCDTQDFTVENVDSTIDAELISVTDPDCGLANGEVQITVIGGTAPYIYDWFPEDATPGDSTLTDIGEGMYFVTITDANNCSLVLDNIELLEDCVDCNEVDVIAISSNTIPIYDCSGQAAYCTDIDLEDVLNFTITDNGLPYSGNFWGCEFDSVLTFSAFTIPSQGTFGPYHVDSWTVNSVTYSGVFMDIYDLVDSMNVWDPSSNWVYNNLTLIISGGNPANSYSNIKITQTLTGAFSILDININLAPNSTAFSISEGPHELIFTDVNGCSDSLYVEVFCITPEYIVDTIFVDTQDTLCFTSDELPGTIQYLENACEEMSGEFVLFEDMDGEGYCISYYGYEVGTENACIILCDDFGICDTTYVAITVVTQDSSIIGIPPEAISDSISTFQGEEVDIPVMLNDTINGTFDTLYVITPPNYGDVTVNDDGPMTYQPDEEYCSGNEPDTYTYVLCNTYACDTTIVTVTVLCEGVTVFTGFSPNGDGVNDFFTIQGIENYADSELSIFNRWGNAVYFKKGYLNDWEGTWEGKILPDGTYFYVLEDGEGRSYSGYVQIHR